MRLLLDVSAVPARPVGAGRYVIELARHLDLVAAGDDLAPPGEPRDGPLDITLLTRRSDADRWRTLAPRATLESVMPDSRPRRIATEQFQAHHLGPALAIDVWHGPHYTLPRRLAVPAVVTVHDLTFFDHPEWHEPVKVRFFRHAIRSACARAAVIVTVSQQTADRLRELVDPPAPIVVAPHGLDRSRFHPVDPTGPTRPIGPPSPADPTSPAERAGPTDHEIERDRELGALRRIGIDRPYIAHVGTLEPRKDVPRLVAAFGQMLRRQPRSELRLVLAGPDGWGTEEVRRAIVEHRVASRIVRVGYLDTDLVAALYRHAEVVAYPSRAEGFGLPALEALACGAVLVTTADTPMAAFAGEAAVIAPARGVEALADAIEQALDPSIARRLRAAGPIAAAPFTWEASVACHLDAYRLATARGSRGA